MKSSRGIAIKSGDNYYNTGKPCLNGHISKRRTVDGSCCQCRADSQRLQRGLIRASIKAKKLAQVDAKS